MKILSYWNTLRYNRRNWLPADGRKVLKNHWWHSGEILALILNNKCNYHCSYCPMFLTDNKYPQYELSTLEEWKDWIEKYPFWVSEFWLTGGETSHIPYIADLINWLTKRGHHVILFSNMDKIENLIGIKKTFRFVLMPTFHPEFDTKERFTNAVNILKKHFRVLPQEMDSEHQMEFTKHKNKFNNRYWFETDTILHAVPDTPRSKMLFNGCTQAYIYGKKRKSYT